MSEVSEPAMSDLFADLVGDLVGVSIVPTHRVETLVLRRQSLILQRVEPTRSGALEAAGKEIPLIASGKLETIAYGETETRWKITTCALISDTHRELSIERNLDLTTDGVLRLDGQFYRVSGDTIPEQVWALADSREDLKVLSSMVIMRTAISLKGVG